MQNIADFTGYPLSPALTRRVLRYLNGFRLFVAMALAAAFFTGALVQGINFTNTTLAAAVLLVYFAFSVVFILQTGVLPIAFLWLFLQVGKRLLLPPRN